MKEDLISENFTELIDKRILLKIINVQKICILFSFFYHCLSFYEWTVIYFQKASENKYSYYSHNITPIVIIFSGIISFIALIISLKVSKQILKSIEENDARIFNDAIKLNFLTAKIFLAVQILYLIQIIIRTFILK